MPENNRGIYRVLDANLNRWREGLRVVEECCRLLRGEEGNFAVLKELRHRLQLLFPPELQRRCLAAREADSDVGRATFGPTESRRADLPAVLRANCKRCQEAARVIEEYSKVLDAGQVAQEAKSLRFLLYSLEKKLLLGRREKVLAWFGGRGTGPVLYLVADEAFYRGGDFVGDLEKALAAGVGLLQWRRKKGSDRESLARARELRDLCARYRVPFIVNDRPDIACLSGADGLHLGQEDLPLAAARQVVGDQMPIGISTHDREQARAAVAAGVDYLGFGPVFPTPSKENPDPVVGVETLRQVVAEVALPVVAIGGIDRGNVACVRETGVAAVAVIRAVLAAFDFAAAVRSLLPA